MDNIATGVREKDQAPYNWPAAGDHSKGLLGPQFKKLCFGAEGKVTNAAYIKQRPAELSLQG